MAGAVLVILLAVRATGLLVEPRPAGLVAEPKPAGTYYVLATHHKTGTNLMDKLGRAAAKVLAGSEDAYAWCPTLQAIGPDWVNCTSDGHHIPNTTSGEQTRLHNKTVLLLSELFPHQAAILFRAGVPYRMVHSVRDPLAMLVSDYEYNMQILTQHKEWSWDLDLGKNSSRLLDLSIRDGLKLEATGSITVFMKTMAQLYVNTYLDPHVLTIGLEEFFDNYEPTVSKMVTWLFGAAVPKSWFGNLTQEVALAGAKNSRASPHTLNSEAQAWLREASNSEAAGKVRAAQACMGYAQFNVRSSAPLSNCTLRPSA